MANRMQPGFFDNEDRLAKLENLGDPLPRSDSIADWQALRLLLKSSTRSSARVTPGVSRTMSR